jgi:hypothetical protein
MNADTKKSRKTSKRYIEMSTEEARKKTEEYFTEWKKRRPIDPRDFVLEEKDIFCPLLAKKLTPAEMRDYLRASFEIEKSMTYCKKLIKDLKARCANYQGPNEQKPQVPVSQV